MMLTRCPACQTVFRLRTEQLHARRGEVRCGHCFHPFNAIEHALEPPANEAPAAPPPAPDFFILEDKPAPPPAGLSPASMLDFGIPEPEPEPRREPPFAEKPSTWKVDQETAQHAAPPAAPDHAPPSASTPAAEPAPHAIPAASATYEPTTYEPADTALPKVFPGVLRSGRRPTPLTEPAPASASPDEANESPDATTDITLPPSPSEPARTPHDLAEERGPHEVTEDAAPEALDVARLDAPTADRRAKCTPSCAPWAVRWSWH